MSDEDNDDVGAMRASFDDMNVNLWVGGYWHNGSRWGVESDE